jgi:Kef-type K+ transport system membrane component KefB
MGPLVVGLANLAVASADNGHAVIGNIALCMVAASILGFIMKLTKQPLILGYVLAGVVIGPIGLRLITDNSEIATISEIGLILLLFMIGLEIDLKKMLSAGSKVIVPGILQFPLCLGAGYLAFHGLKAVGLSVGESAYAELYCAIAISMSSTMIVVKLLFDKFELDTLPGRITVGILVFQDIWAIMVLAVQPNFADPRIGAIALTFLRGALLVGAALLASRYVLPIVYRTVARVPELLLVISLGWCFMVALVAALPQVGLSMEMGALIAGVSLATFPYNVDVIAKVVSIRDFFITLFFVALGMTIPLPQGNVLLVAGVVALIAIAVRFFGIFGVLYSLNSGHRASLLATINLGQISEFALVILTLGVALVHVEGGTLTTITWVFALLAVASTYGITYSHPLQRGMSRVLNSVGILDLASVQEETGGDHQHPIVMLGFFRIASAFLDEVLRKHPHLKESIKVVDFNPEVREKLTSMGVACVYGDVSNADTLHHANIHHAQLVLCTIPDAFLKGTNNEKLVDLVRKLCPHAKVLVTAERTTHARELYDVGADYVIQPSVLAGESVAKAVELGLSGDLDVLRSTAREELGLRNEVLA